MLGSNSSAMVLTLFLLTLGTAAGFAQTGGEAAGRYWVDVKRQGSDYFIVTLGIEARQPLRVRSVRVPDFVDASLLPRQREVLPLIATEIKFPVKFIGRGTGRLYLEVRSTGISGQACYLLFDLHNGTNSVLVRRGFGQYGEWWESVGGGKPSIQFGKITVTCSASLPNDVSGLDLFSPGIPVSGVLLAGCSVDVASDAAGFDATGWGLRYAANRADKIVGSFAKAPFDTAIAVAEPRPPRTGGESGSRSRSGQPGGERPAETVSRKEPTEERKPAETEPTVTKSEPEKKPEPKPEPASGPYSGASSAGTIAAFAFNWAQSKQLRQDGRFGETVVTMPPEFFQLKQVDKAELVLRIGYAQRSGGANGRIFINSFQSIEPKDPAHDKGAFWYGDRRGGREQFLGDFTTDHAGKEFRFDITNWVRSNPGEQFYIIVENLAVAAIEVSEARIEFSGIR